MNTYLIILYLSTNEDKYVNLTAYLKTAPHWARPFPGVWLVKALNPVVQIRDGIKSRVLPEDKVIVIDVTKNGWATNNISQEVTDWMKKNL